MQHRVGDGADAGLQRQQAVVQPACVDLGAQEIIDVAGDGVGLIVRRQGIGRAVRLLGDNDGRDPGRIHFDVGLADALVHRHQADGFARGTILRHIDVVQPFDGGRHADVQLDDDALGLQGEGRRIAHGHGGHDGAAFGNGGGFDDGHVDGPDMAGAQLFGGFRKMLVDEGDLALVDLAPQRGVDLERHATRQRIGLRQHLVGIVAQRGAGDQRDRQRLALRPPGQRRRHRLTVARAGESAHADGHAVLDQQGRLFGGSDPGVQAGMADTVEMHGVSRFEGRRPATGPGTAAFCPDAV